MNKKRLLLKLITTTMAFCMLISIPLKAIADTTLSNGKNPVTENELTQTKSKYIVLMDFNSGNILYSKNGDSKIYPASTTKIWTAFLVINHVDNLDKLVTIKNMPQAYGSSMYLENGEKFTIRELLDSLLIHSSNDVACFLAEYVSGSVEDFSKLMNSEAKKYGAYDTHFNNPNGLPDTNHYTTAEDMVKLARVAYSNPVIQNIVSTTSVHFPKSENCFTERYFLNSNKFLTSTMSMNYRGNEILIKDSNIDGIKTGYTDDALNCLLSTAQIGNERLISGVYFAPAGSLYHDSKLTLQYGFDNFKSSIIFNKNDFKGQKSVSFAKPGKINYIPSTNFSVITDKNKPIEKSTYSTSLNFKKINLPVKKGDVIGTLDIYDKNHNQVSSIALLSENNVVSYFDFILNSKPATFFKSLGSSIKKQSNVVLKNASVKLKENDDIKNLQETNFYKFLEKKVEKNAKGFDPFTIIIGIPFLLLILIFLLIILILKDCLRNKSNSKKKKNSLKK